MKRASCACGQLSISLVGEPRYVLACHCRECQKATGSLFGVSTYWSKESVSGITGESTQFTRRTDSGGTLTHHFCSTCGGRVYRYASFYPAGIGVAYGGFDTTDLPRPTDEYWTQRRHDRCGFTYPIVQHVGDD